jgi:hypothetical protein
MDLAGELEDGPATFIYWLIGNLVARAALRRRTARPQPERPAIRLRDFSRLRRAGNPAVPGP